MDEHDPPASAKDGCTALVALAARAAVPGIAPDRFIDRLGHDGAGVRPGLPGILDLARAGANHLPGHGFREELDDGTGGQVRHFCGIATSCRRFGSRLTWSASVYLRRDAPDTPDGRLTDLAIEFVERLRRGDLDVRDASDWLQRTLCQPSDPDAEDPEDDEPDPPATFA